MKITIDTDKKILAIEEQMPMLDLLKLVQRLFPDDWKEWKLETKTVQNVTHTTVIREVATEPYRFQPQPWGQPQITFEPPFTITC